MLSDPFSLRGAMHRAGRQILLRAEFGIAAGVLAVAAAVFALMAAYLGLRPALGPAGAAAVLAVACLAVAALIFFGLRAKPAPDAATPDLPPTAEVSAETAAFLLAFVLARRIGRD